MQRPPARIHVLLASDAPVGLVIRRGPSKCVATMLWDRRRDTFTLGQWLKGRIYEDKCDLSPDGKYFIYFAMNGKWQEEARGSWTAISRAPYLKALALFPKGDTWNGGGLWIDATTYWLNDGYGHSLLWDTTLVRRDTRHFPADLNFDVRAQRLLRDGWTRGERMPIRKRRTAEVFEKALPRNWKLRRIIGFREDGRDEHQLRQIATDEVISYPDWEWADIDGRRLVWASGGKLHGAQLGETGVDQTAELFDFNDMEFEAIPAPY